MSEDEQTDVVEGDEGEVEESGEDESGEDEEESEVENEEESEVENEVENEEEKPSSGLKRKGDALTSGKMVVHRSKTPITTNTLSRVLVKSIQKSDKWMEQMMVLNRNIRSEVNELQDEVLFAFVAQ